MNVTAIIHNTIAGFGGLFTICGERFFDRKVVRPRRHLAVAARDIDHKVGLTEPGHPAAQRTHDVLAVF